MKFDPDTYPETFCERCQSFKHDTADCPRPEPRRAGTANADETLAYHWAVFSRRDVQAWLECDPILVPPAHLAADLLGWTAFDRGPGRAFASTPHVRVMSRNILITQRVGLDI